MNRRETLRELKEVVLTKAGESSLALDFDAALANPDRIHELNLAAERASSGSYGHCIGCNRPIPLARLRIKPEAVRCIKCQEAYEGAHPVQRTA